VFDRGQDLSQDPQPILPEADVRAQGDVRLRAFVDAVFDAYYDWNIRTDVMLVSEQMATLLHLDPDQLPDTFEAYAERMHPDDVDRTLRNTRHAASECAVYQDEYRILRGDGSYVSVRERGVTLADEKGRPSHMIGAVRDITAELESGRVQREAAQLYQTLFAQAVNPAFHVAEDGRFLDANGAALNFLAITKTSLLRKTVRSLWGDDATAAVRAAIVRGRIGSTLDLEIEIGETPKAMTVTLVPCWFHGERTCFMLGTDVTQHHDLQRALAASEESLRRQAAALEDANTALRVILEQRNRDRADLERTIVANVETTIVPLLEQLHRHLAGSPEAIYVDAVNQNLRELVLPFAQSLDGLATAEGHLTQREREIATLIRAGKSSQEIAEALYISPATVAFHRKNLRRKLGLPPRGPSLATHLSRLPTRDRDAAGDALDAAPELGTEPGPHSPSDPPPAAADPASTAAPEAVLPSDLPGDSD